MPRGAAEVADVFRRYGDAYRQQHGSSLSTAQRRVMTAIEQCRTAALGADEFIPVSYTHLTLPTN